MARSKAAGWLSAACSAATPSTGVVSIPFPNNQTSTQMKPKFLFLFFVLLLLAAALSACSNGAVIASSWPGVTLGEDVAYIAHAQHLYAVRTSNGVQMWRYPEKATSNISFYAPPAITPDEQIIVGGYDHVLYSLNANGQVNWQFSEASDRYIAPPLATEKGIFAPNADGKLYALDLNGKPLWTPFKTGGPLWAPPVTDNLCHCLYLSSMDHYLYAIDPESGAQIWKTEDLGGAIVSAPALSADNILYLGTFGSEMLALEAKNGQILWRKPTLGWVWSSPAIDEGRLYFGDLSGNFYAFDAASGEQLWKIPPEKENIAIAGTPTLKDGIIYFTTEAGVLFAVDTEGNIQWSQTIKGKLYAPPLSQGELLLVAPSESEDILVALNPEGAIKWSFNPNPQK